MLHHLRRRWFLVLLLLVIPLGFLLGGRARAQTVSTFPRHIVELVSGILNFTILFLMSVTLENSKLRQSLRSPAPVVWASAVNFGLLPALAYLAMPLQGMRDLAIGLMAAASVPSTLAAASVWTRKAGGNDAVSLLTTILTNASCFVLTPLWLQIGLGGSVQLDTPELIVKLFFTALLPIVIGQGCRAWPAMRGVADRGKAVFTALAQVCILLIVFWASIQGGVKLNATQGSAGQFSIWPALVCWLTCIVLHLAALAIAAAGGRSLKLRREDVVAAAFAGSQKTLPIGLLVATELAGKGVPFVVFPILMYHASQLILDTMIADWFHRWLARHEGEEPPAGS